MPSYYFHVRTTDNHPHIRQVHELTNIRQALVLAQGTARALIRAQAPHARGALRGSLDIEDESGQPVARIPFADVARQAF